MINNYDQNEKLLGDQSSNSIVMSTKEINPEQYFPCLSKASVDISESNAYCLFITNIFLPGIATSIGAFLDQ